MKAGQRGFTLIELMVSVVVLAVFGAVAFGLGTQIERERRAASGYESDVVDIRRSLRSIERDVRAAHRVEVGDEALVLHTDDGPVAYRLTTGELRRTGAGGHEAVLARCVADLEVSEDDGLVRVALALRTRSAVTPRRTACLATSVAMRNQEGRR